MADQITTELIVKAVSEGFGKVSKDIKGVGSTTEDTQKKTGTFGDKLKGLAGTFAIVASSAVAVGAAIKVAFDLGREGAAIAQTKQSFDGLLSQWAIAPGYLEKMQEASNGTIKDLDIMASTLTLVAGAGKEMGTAMIDSSPRLMEIAKAANKLNPSLGTTAFMYDSITKGIKRNSPMILDNLGIIVKVGEANETYAKKIGKTVSALTAEEKSIALLNAVMEQGDNLVQQAGGNTDSLTDSYDQLTVSVGNMTDAFKEFIANALNPAVEGINRYIGVQDELTKAVKDGIITKEEDAAIQMALKGGMMDYAAVLEIVEERTLENTKKQEAAKITLDKVTGATYDAAGATGELADVTEDAIDAFEPYIASAKDVADALKQIYDNAVKAAQGNQELAESLMDLDAAGVAKEQIRQLNDMMEKDPKNAERYAASIKEIAISAGLATPETYAMAEATSMLKGMIKAGALDVMDYEDAWDVANQTAADGRITWEELQLALIDAGMTTQEQTDVMNGIDLGEATREAQGLASPLMDIYALPGSKLFEITVKTTYIGQPYMGSVKGWGGGGVSAFENVIEGASGLDFTVPPGFSNDSFGPIMVQSGEHVSVTPAGDTNGMASEIARLNQNIMSLFGQMQANNNTIYVNDQGTGSALLDMIRTN